MPGEFEHGAAAVFLVEQHAVAIAAVRDSGGGLHGEHLELYDLFRIRSGALGYVFQLHAMIASESQQRRNVPAARRHPVYVVDRLVLAQRMVPAAMLQEELQLLEGRIFRRAKQPRDGEGAAATFLR